jgi:hypothetical protein
MSDLDDALSAKRVAEKEINALDQELQDDDLPPAERATAEAKLGALELKRDRIVARIESADAGQGALHTPTDAERQKLKDAADALDRVAANQQLASAIIDTVSAAIEVFAT